MSSLHGIDTAANGVVSIDVAVTDVAAIGIATMGIAAIGVPVLSNAIGIAFGTDMKRALMAVQHGLCLERGAGLGLMSSSNRWGRSERPLGVPSFIHIRKCAPARGDGGIGG
eukprot:1339096-Amorphochlora_amoeboformis.AAC.3